MKDNIKTISKFIHFIIPTDSSHDKMRKYEHLLTNITPQLEDYIQEYSRNTETMIEDTKE